MILTDIHCHLDFSQFKNVDQVINNSIAAGVKKIINNGVNPKSNRKVLELTQKYDIVEAALGLYPTDALELTDKEFDDELDFIRENKAKIIALGEIGLDYHWKPETKEKQKINFKKIIDLALELDKPLIVHSRKAEQDTLNMLIENKVKKAVMHCFNGSFDLVEKAVKQGYYFSIPCIITTGKHFKKLVKKIPMDKILTETDAPYMSPFKGQLNEPKNVIETIKKIAELKKLTPEETANHIFMNYQRLF